MKISLVNPATNQIKRAKIGFSWTTFFFGFWPALFRGDWLWFIIMFVTETMLGYRTYAFGSLIVGIVFAFIYNKLYINGLLNKGWVAADAYSNNALISNGFITANQNFTGSNANQPMSRVNFQNRSHPVSVILAIIAAVCVVFFVYFSFGSMIESNFINLINPTKVQNKSNNQTPSQTNIPNSTPSQTQSSNDDNSQSPATEDDNQSDKTTSPLSNTIKKVKNQVDSNTDKSDDTPKPDNNPSPSTTTGNDNNSNTPKTDNTQSNPTNKTDDI